MTSPAEAAVAGPGQKSCGSLGCPGGLPPATTTTPGASEGQLTISIQVEGRTSAGGPYSRSTTKRVAPACWYARWWSGQQYFEYRTSPEYQHVVDQMPAQYQSAPFPDYESHASEDDGFWYTALCSGAAPNAYVISYVTSHPPRFVPAGQAPPPAAQDVSPEVLAQAAYEALVLPEGTVAWNPHLAGAGGASAVGLETWVWLEDAPATAQVTASVPAGTWATVEAHVTGMVVTAGQDRAQCDSVGMPWSEGAGEAPCSIRFTRGSARGDTTTGTGLRAWTITVDSTWAASWTSSLDATPRELGIQHTEVTGQIAVAEIQGLVTRS